MGKTADFGAKVAWIGEMVHYWVKIRRNGSFLGKTGQDWAKRHVCGPDWVKWFILGPSGSILGKTGHSGAKFWGKAPGFWEKAAFEMFVHSSGSSGGASGTGGGSEGPSPTLRCSRGVGDAANSQISGVFCPFWGTRRYSQDGGGTHKMAAAHPKWRPHSLTHPKWGRARAGASKMAAPTQKTQDGDAHLPKMAPMRMRSDNSAPPGRGWRRLDQSAAAQGGGPRVAVATGMRKCAARMRSGGACG